MLVDRGERKKIVLLGIGHTNAHVVGQWAKHPIAGCDLICISDYPTTTYSGMLPGTLASQFQDSEMRIDLASLAARAGATLLVARTCGLDRENARVFFSDREPVPFDLLSIGVGSRPVGSSDFEGSPLLVPVKPMQTFLQRLWSHLRQADSHSRDHAGTGNRVDHRKIAIVGGGVASIEIALCLHHQLEHEPIGGPWTIEIISGTETVASGLTRRGVRRIDGILQQRGIVVHRGTRVTDVDASSLTTQDGQRRAVSCVVWATGASPPPVLSTLDLDTDESGFVATAATLQSTTDPRIFAVGDSGTIVGHPAPKAGVYAVRQAPVLWHNLNAAIDRTPMKSFEPQRDFLKLINTGDGKAILEYGRWSTHGRWCWELKKWIDKRFIREFQSERSAQ